MFRETTAQSQAQQISFAGQAQLLDITYARLRFSVNAIPWVSIPLAWFYSVDHSAGGLIAWGCSYAVAALVMRWLYSSRYLAEKKTCSDEELLHIWSPRIGAIALVHGFGLAAPVLITAGSASFEFGLLLLVSLAAIVAANATHQTAVFPIFFRFYMACWNSTVLLVYWLFPDHWQFILPLTIIYSHTIYKHGKAANGFFVNQILLEERAAILATQFKAAKDEAEQALESKSLFLSTASHDLRQPVFAIGMLTEAIASKNTDVKITQLLGNLRSSVHSLNLMFNSLLDLSRIEAGHEPVRQVSVNLKHLVHEVVALFDDRAQAAGLQLRVHVPKNPLAVTADPDLLRQALINLTHNALRYTRRGGVLIGVRQRGTQWQLAVWDTGIGVADGEQEKIYSPYYRNEHAWRTDATGHGLGLHVVARCAKLMKARYGLVSKLGRGSQFWLRLAQADPTSAPPAVVNAPTAASHGLLGGRCLVLEDDPQVVDAWAALLGAWQVEVRFAANSREAFAAIHAGFAPGAIFCDQRLRSGESGFDVLRDLLEVLPSARGAMVSGEYASPELARAEDEGYLVIRKPLNIEQLYTVLSRWLAK